MIWERKILDETIKSGYDNGTGMNNPAGFLQKFYQEVAKHGRRRKKYVDGWRARTRLSVAWLLTFGHASFFTQHPDVRVGAIGREKAIATVSARNTEKRRMTYGF